MLTAVNATARTTIMIWHRRICSMYSIGLLLRFRFFCRIIMIEIDVINSDAASKVIRMG